MDQLPFSQASENNKAPILEILQATFTTPGLILEIGSGTGQHAEHFARHLPHLTWQPSDRPGFQNVCLPRIEASGLTNIRAPLPLDVTQQPWPIDVADSAFSANTAHIMSWSMVEAMFAGVGRLLQSGGCFCLYGPFNENDDFTSASNARFDAYLKSQDPAMGIRDRAAIERLATQNGLTPSANHTMPANNRLLVFGK
ncbi:DUF938 domain-containing protein [Mangrovitalea sediminis]|uniref:DUF938 domain-containing protein n=1 Tax=Mangrovitalea sediminis TaxID=1982043 RepID=UPI000BE5629D|nr:DUF938 domain-containing protein [Mangrovitalea sediminis]